MPLVKSGCGEGPALLPCVSVAHRARRSRTGPTPRRHTQYDQAGDILQHTHGDALLRPTGWSAPADNHYRVAQRPYAPPGSWPHLQMGELGHAYVPTRCHGASFTGCRLHVHCHGCGDLQRMPNNGLGYNEWAEANDIVVLYPIVKPSASNLLDCWDWWGATGETFDTNQGIQLVTVMNIIQHLHDAIQWRDRR